MAYQASTEEHSIDIVNIASLEGKVKERISVVVQKMNGR